MTLIATHAKLHPVKVILIDCSITWSYIRISILPEVVPFLFIFSQRLIGEVSFNVSLTSRNWGSEISWTLGDCSSDTIYENHDTHEGECSLPSGQYTLVCKDSYGDGWHGGFIMISGKTYCETFDSGFSETHEVMIGSDTKRHGSSKPYIN